MSIGIAMGIVGYIISLCLMVVMIVLHAGGHTHDFPTGIQDGAEICVEGEAAIDHNLTTRRPFLICGVIRVEEAPPLGSNTYLVNE